MNYFNYFTETEEHFQRARGTSLFLLSPLDWALVESWKNSGVPLEAVLRGIDTAFEKWRSRKVKTQMVNSLAFCAQAVLTEAQIMTEGAPARPRQETAPPFNIDELRRYLEGNAAALPAACEQIAASLRKLAEEAEQHYSDLEGLEQRLTVLQSRGRPGPGTGIALLPAAGAGLESESWKQQEYHRQQNPPVLLLHADSVSDGAAAAAALAMPRSSQLSHRSLCKVEKIAWKQGLEAMTRAFARAFPHSC